MIIFLDMDGVLNTTHVCLSKPRGQYHNNFGLIDPIGVAMINRWVKDIKAELDEGTHLVLSSTGRADVNTRFSAHMFSGMLGITAFFHDDYKTDHLNGCRGDEIKKWLDAHPEHTNYIIIDDDGDFLEEQKPFHIQTSTYDGILFNNHLEFEKILEEMK